MATTRTSKRVTVQTVCRADTDAVVIVEVFSKKTRATPFQVFETCQRRLAAYDQAAREETGR
ncbi:MAG TPA: hypothetical protein VLE46_01870 [Nitrospira sp.]|nr:hypothetical protein [Nitrospira sp.]